MNESSRPARRGHRIGLGRHAVPTDWCVLKKATTTPSALEHQRRHRHPRHSFSVLMGMPTSLNQNVAPKCVAMVKWLNGRVGAAAISSRSSPQAILRRIYQAERLSGQRAPPIYQLVRRMLQANLFATTRLDSATMTIFRHQLAGSQSAFSVTIIPVNSRRALPTV